MELQRAFDPDGVVSIVGAGGKKSTLYALASDLHRAVVTATVRIPLFDEQVAELTLSEDPADAIRNADRWPLGLVPGRDAGRERYLGYDPDVIDALAPQVEPPILIKADGARTRWFKAPNDEEPQIPDTTDLVVPVVSVRVVGKRLDDEYVHRPERVADLAGKSPGDPIRSADVVAVLTHGQGGLKRVPEDARVVPLINMVDNDDLKSTAGEIAADLLSHPRIDRVVLGRMDRKTVVDVVE